MNKVQLATRINPKIKKAMQEVCEANGLIMSRFIEDAIKVRLEEYQDIRDLKRISKESTRPLSDVLAKRSKGKV